MSGLHVRADQHLLYRCVCLRLTSCSLYIKNIWFYSCKYFYGCQSQRKKWRGSSRFHFLNKTELQRCYYIFRLTDRRCWGLSRLGFLATNTDCKASADKEFSLRGFITRNNDCQAVFTFNVLAEQKHGHEMSSRLRL